MRYNVSHVSVHQSSKILALLYGLLGILYIPILFLANYASPEEEKIPGVIIWLMPIILAVVCYVLMALFFALYNALAKRMGGVELTLTQTSEETT